jgi:conjugal transfer/type IV secretion protein DotA/TraY
MDRPVRKVLAYTLLPGIWPRTRSFLSSGFAHLALFMALVYRSAGLLPSHHPYFNTENFGQFGLRHVISEAGRNLVYKREYLDQIIIYYLLFVGIILLFLQTALLMTAITVQTAKASSTGAYYASFFKTPTPENDIAFTLLDLVFGIPGIFNSKAATNPDSVFPTPFQEGLHALFNFYNTGLLAVAMIIFLYFIAAIVAETTQSGIPFGKRFNKAWAPIRFMLFVLLMMPVTHGINIGQYTLLHVAKWGSSMGTNGWNTFTTTVFSMPLTTPSALNPAASEGVQTPMGNSNLLIGTPNTPGINNLLEFIFVAQACRFMQKQIHDRDIAAYIVHKNKEPLDFVAADYEEALAFSDNGNIVVRFGEKDDVYKNLEGNVNPTCGEITLETLDISHEGAMVMQKAYHYLVWLLWLDDVSNYYAFTVSSRITPTIDKNPWQALPSTNYLKTTTETYNEVINDAINDAVIAQRKSEKWAFDLQKLGWGGAGIWYNKIAEANSSITRATFNVPTPQRYPAVMEHVQEERRRSEENLTAKDRFNPYLSGKKINFTEPGDEYIALALFYAQSFWFDHYPEPTGNVFKDSVGALLGTSSLFQLDKNTNIHPLAQLVSVGSALIESATINFGFAIGAGIGGGLAHFMDMPAGKTIALSAAKFSWQIAMIGLMIGFVLLYVLPFLPFMYFFFAIGGWVKSIFEAMVGIPLWALAHLRIDGEGLVGQGAMNGYYLLFEIFIRPLLIVIGLVASISIFGAQVTVLNEVWELITKNMTGFDATEAAANNPGTIKYLRGEADEFFHTIMYAIVVYMLGMSAFKLIDLVPNQILRWLGASVSTFQENLKDPAGELVKYVFGGSVLFQRLGVGKGMSSSMQALMVRNG